MQQFVTILAALVVAYIAMMWMALPMWTFNDVRARSQNVVTQLLATMVVFVTGPFGLVLYWMLRPQQTLVEAYAHSFKEVLSKKSKAGISAPRAMRASNPTFSSAHHVRRNSAASAISVVISWRPSGRSARTADDKRGRIRCAVSGRMRCVPTIDPFVGTHRMHRSTLRVQGRRMYVGVNGIVASPTMQAE